MDPKIQELLAELERERAERERERQWRQDAEGSFDQGRSCRRRPTHTINLERRSVNGVPVAVQAVRLSVVLSWAM
ncbi:hypothetical protein PAAG_11814 [Paracoccidioides lutzii Pb01]|uniref:Uncharacterized protein n=1 Tax=Paracoccidioides lutzii (strain ATCC MYA-826 / Pb01) TaxID=502779 RepID=A0A0A2VKP3_PARBA|nr:hypothetical protein PAAG_11814 [Paracoccidioides lutzii Pb01]KGQ01464.1 hypothetical protein PAAG_11814 [Paracoccidioides lutzii Pb01]